MSCPSGPTSAFVQGIWSASVTRRHSGPVVKLLHSEACSSLWFHLEGEVKIGHTSLPGGVIALPVEKASNTVSLFPASQLAGIRFQPAIGYGVVGLHVEQPTVLTSEHPLMPGLQHLFRNLQTILDHENRLTTLHRWVQHNFHFTQRVPGPLKQALDCLNHTATPGALNDQVNISQRHLERLFRHWIEMTPKQYQRILRVKRAIDHLRTHSGTNLAEVADQFGFSDQAHMTREFRAITGLTPGKL